MRTAIKGPQDQFPPEKMRLPLSPIPGPHEHPSPSVSPADPPGCRCLSFWEAHWGSIFLQSPLFPILANLSTEQAQRELPVKTLVLDDRTMERNQLTHLPSSAPGRWYLDIFVSSDAWWTQMIWTGLQSILDIHWGAQGPSGDPGCLLCQT